MQFFLQFIKTTNSISRALILEFPVNDIKFFLQKNYPEFSKTNSKMTSRTLQNSGQKTFQNSPENLPGFPKKFQDFPKFYNNFQNKFPESKKLPRIPQKTPRILQDFPKFAKIWGYYYSGRYYQQKQHFQDFPEILPRILQNSPKFSKISKILQKNSGESWILENPGRQKRVPFRLVVCCLILALLSKRF